MSVAVRPISAGLNGAGLEVVLTIVCPDCGGPLRTAPAAAPSPRSWVATVACSDCKEVQVLIVRLCVSTAHTPERRPARWVSAGRVGAQLQEDTA